MKSKREIALEKCLEKTLKDLYRFAKLHARIGNTISHYYLIKNTRINVIRGRIKLALKTVREAKARE